MAMDQPELPEGINWPQTTIDWWNSLPSTPGAERWTESDWQYLMTTAIVHSQVWGGDMTLLRELREREEKYGITPAARNAIGKDVETGHVERHTTLDEIMGRRKLRVIDGGKKTQRRTGT